LTTSKIAKVLEILIDGQWHTTEGIQREATMDKKQLKHVIAFLEEYDFLLVDEERKRIKLKDTFLKFLTLTSTA